MPNKAYDEALKEAYASVPDDEIVLHTLELRHPEFKDDAGNVVAIRVVQNYEDQQTWRDKKSADIDAVLDALDEETLSKVGLVARLEADAPIDAGEMVYFIALAFELEEPKIDTQAAPEATISIDNVGKEVLKHLDNAAVSRKKVEVTYRSYLMTDVEKPQEDPPMTMVLSEAKPTPLRIQGRAGVSNIGNRSFPQKKHTVKRSPGLAR